METLTPDQKSTVYAGLTVLEHTAVDMAVAHREDKHKQA